MTLNRSTFTELLLDEGQKKIFGMAYNDYQREFDKFFDVENSQHAFEYYLETFGLGLFSEVGEKADIPMDYAGQSYKTTITPIKFGNGYDVTKEMIDDQQFAHIQKLARDLGLSAGESQDTHCIDYINNYATNTTQDGIALVATTHVVSRTGGTFQNRPTTPSSLSPSSVEDDDIYVGRMVSPSGRKKAYKLRKMMVPRELKHQALKIFGTEKDPFTNKNAINTVHGSKVVDGFMVSEYLTSATTYFYRTNTDGLLALIRQGLEFDSEYIKRRQFTEYYATYRMQVGCYDPRSIWANGMAS